MERTVELIDLLDRALDVNGNPKACGRDVCKKLIQVATQEFPGPNYGDVETGYMNVENLFMLKIKLSDEE